VRAERTRRAILQAAETLFAELIKTIEQGQSDGEMRAIDPMHFLMTTAGATIFVFLGTVHFAPDAPPAIPHQVELHRRELPDRHRQKLLAVVRATTAALLGADAPDTESEQRSPRATRTGGG
jgi:hypothetical protein